MDMEKPTSVGALVVDGSNAAAGGGFRPPTLQRLRSTVAAAATKFPNARVLTVVDANLRYALAESDSRELEEEIKTGTIISAPARTIGAGDAVILEIASALSAVIVSNDCFRDFVEEFPFLTEVGRIFGIVSLDDGPTLLVARKLGSNVA